MNIKFKKTGIVLLGYNGVHFHHIVMSFHIFLVVIHLTPSGLCLSMGGQACNARRVQVEEFTECQNCFDLFEKPIKHAYGIALHNKYT